MKVGHFEVIDPVPVLHDAVAIAMLRPWVDVGSAGTLALGIVERHMMASELGRLARPGKFLDFTRDRPVMTWEGGVRSLSIPNTIVTYAHDAGTGRDFIFLHLREPHMNGEEYCEAIVELVERFGVVEYCRIGGMYDQVPHTRPIKITATLPDEHLDRLTGIISSSHGSYQGPTSIVNLIADGLDSAGIESSSLMAHIPHYVQLEEDYMASARLLDALCEMYDWPRFLADKTRGQRQYDQIERALAGNDEVRKHIARMEQDYDESNPPPAPDDPTDEVALPENMEEFLREVGKRLDDEETTDRE